MFHSYWFPCYFFSRVFMSVCQITKCLTSGWRLVILVGFSRDTVHCTDRCFNNYIYVYILFFFGGRSYLWPAYHLQLKIHVSVLSAFQD